MDFIASFYPALSERRPYPALYLPSCFILTLLPFLLPDRRLSVVVTFSILLVLCVRAPFYTFGDASSNYYNSGTFPAMLFWYIDFLVLTPEKGTDAPVLLGDTSKKRIVEHQARNLSDNTTIMQKLRWAARLMIPPNRGIGWNWQVKGVPPDPHKDLAKWTYVAVHLRIVVTTYIRSAVMLLLMGLVSEIQKRTSGQVLLALILDAAIGWSGAMWICDRLNCFYSLAAAVTVATGINDTWEWPPLMGSFKDGWSVRQIWRYVAPVYHQVLRRMVQQPARRITRFLGIQKGTVASGYSQLYISFGLSCFFHQFQMFHVTRHDTGEFAFFMMQPVAITVESLIESTWRRRGRNPSIRRPFHSTGMVLGYIWVIFWFSWCLPIYVKGLRDADIIRDALLDTRPFDAGAAVGHKLMMHITNS